MRYNDAGEEIPDDSPLSVPLRFRNKPVSNLQEVMQLMKIASAAAEREGLETEEEANDFRVEDELGFEGHGSALFTEQDENELLTLQKEHASMLSRRNQATKEKENAEGLQSGGVKVDRSSSGVVGGDVRKASESHGGETGVRRGESSRGGDEGNRR